MTICQIERYIVTTIKQRLSTGNPPKIVLVCTGPTAAWVDYNRLDHIPLFGMNYAFKITDLDYYATFHPGNIVKQEMKDYASTLPFDNVFCQEGETFGRQVHGLPGHEFKTDVFSSGMSGFYGSSVFQMMQVIYSLGFREIYIVGMDADAEAPLLHVHDQKADREQMRQLFIDMKHSAELVQAGKPEDLKIFNCSPISKIKAFPYFDISLLYIPRK